MKILFVGNSHLTHFYYEYKNNPLILGADTNCSFAIELGGWGPHFTVNNDRLICSNRDDPIKLKYPDKFFPDNLLETNLALFDVIVVLSVGYIGGGLDSEGSIVNSFSLFDFGPKTELRPISKCEAIDTFEGFFDAQGGIQFLRSLDKFQGNKIVIEMPLHSSKIKEHPGWILKSMYDDPIAAYNWFSGQRRKFLEMRASELGFQFIPALFSDVGFTPSEFIDKQDLFHTNSGYAKLMYSEISKFLINGGESEL